MQGTLVVTLSTSGVLGCSPVIPPSRSCMMGVKGSTLGILPKILLGPFLGLGSLGVLGIVFCVMHWKGEMVFALGKD